MPERFALRTRQQPFGRAVEDRNAAVGIDADNAGAGAGQHRFGETPAAVDQIACAPLTSVYLVTPSLAAGNFQYQMAGTRLRQGFAGRTSPGHDRWVWGAVCKLLGGSSLACYRGHSVPTLRPRIPMPIVNRVADLQPDIQAWRREIHQHPESVLRYPPHLGIRRREVAGIRLRRGCDRSWSYRRRRRHQGQKPARTAMSR